MLAISCMESFRHCRLFLFMAAFSKVAEFRVAGERNLTYFRLRTYVDENMPLQYTEFCC